MALEARIWRIDAEQPTQLEPSRLGEEKRLREWLCSDGSLLSDKLLVIGQRISLDGGTLAILAVDHYCPVKSRANSMGIQSMSGSTGA